MTALNATADTDTSTLDARLIRIGGVIARVGLILVIGWIGVQKFTTVEAHNIEHFVGSSPFMSWLYNFMSVTMFSDLLGVFEVSAAVLLAVKPWLPRVSVVGSGLSILLFLATISFLFTTPGVLDPAQGGFPWLSSAGQFLLKDVTLLGASVWTLGDALRSARIGRNA